MSFWVTLFCRVILLPFFGTWPPSACISDELFTRPECALRLLFLFHVKFLVTLILFFPPSVKIIKLPLYQGSKSDETFLFFLHEMPSIPSQEPSTLPSKATVQEKSPSPCCCGASGSHPTASTSLGPTVKAEMKMLSLQPCHYSDSKV